MSLAMKILYPEPPNEYDRKFTKARVGLGYHGVSAGVTSL